MNVVVGGIRYEGFLSVRVQAKMGSLAREFEFMASTRGIEDVPFRAGQGVRIYDGDELLVTGWIERISMSSAAKGHTYTINGRDLMGDVVDSNLPRADDLQGDTLPVVCKKVLKFLGIRARVVDLANTSTRPFRAIISPDPEDTAGDFLSQLARRKRALLQSDEFGNLVITEGIGLRTASKLINRKDGVGNNLLEASLTVDHSQRFGRYSTELQVNMASGDNVGLNEPVEKIVAQHYFLDDPSIRSSRLRTTAADYNLGVDEALDRPRWEIALNRAESIKYRVSVQGFRDVSGNLWKVNTAPVVLDEYNGILDKKMLIAEVAYEFSGDGRTTRMVLTDRDAFKAELKIRKDIEIDGSSAT